MDLGEEPEQSVNPVIEAKPIVGKENSPISIDDDTDGARKFYLYVAFMELFALLSFILVLVWTENYLGGFAWDGSGRTFNYHPVFMVSGMVIMYGNSAVAYRVLRSKEKFVLKLIHAGLHFGTFIFTILGLVTVFDFHNKNKIPNMYSLHSWVGMATVVLFSCQLFTGFFGFLYPKFNDDRRREYLKVHVFFGGVIFAFAIVSCISGITEKMLFGFMATYKNFPAVGIVANVLGSCLIVFGIMVGFILCNPSFKRLEKYEQIK